MWKRWTVQPVVWGPADEGAPGGEGDGAGGEAESGGEGGVSGDPGDGGDPPAGSILDALEAAKTAETKEGTEEKKGEGWKPPEGIPEHLRGKDADETIAKLQKAYAGARQELSKRPGPQGTVPDAPEGYALKPVGDKDPIAAEWSNPESKPFVDAFQAAAHELKIPAELFSDLMRKGLEKVGDLGIPIGRSEEDLIEFSAEKEMGALVKAVGEKEALTMLTTVDTYARKLTDSGLLTKEEQAELRVMVGTAESARVFYKIMTAEFGERPIPPADPNAGAVSQTDAYALHAKASAMPPGAEKDAALAAANLAIQRAVGTAPAGAIRSNVL
jgi:hypothetical protein